MNEEEAPCAKEMADQMQRICIMFRHFGWVLPALYAACARDELLSMAGILPPYLPVVKEELEYEAPNHA